ncbi:hypothetical protein [Spirosoma spitsbergense]|uniref:hypothetical protein n=1 Tax=Spirosoma spitsbergense TaxID=431554 RepID=UPI0003741BAA|nr:hypothetical protein [Spirosoma spitsbergense]
MKTQTLLVAGLLLAGGATAQIQKGNSILSGELAVTYGRNQIAGSIGSATSSQTSTSWYPNLSVTAGRFWADNWLVGVSVSGSLTNQYYYPTGSTGGQAIYYRVTSIRGTPFLRRYWQVNSLFLFAGAGLSVGVSTTKRPALNNNGQLINDAQRTSVVDVAPQVEVGANYFLTNRLALQLTATANALPINTAGLRAGLVYWTGSGLPAGGREERENSQTNVGKWLIEGSFSAVSQKNTQLDNATGSTNQTRSSTHSVSPSIGYFIRKNSLIGISLPVSWGLGIRSSTGADARLVSVGVSPYYQHYWTSTRLTPYTRLNVGYARMSGKEVGASQPVYTANTFSGGINMGLAYMAGQRFIIETSLLQASVDYTAFDAPNFGNYTNVWNGALSAGLGGTFAVRYVLN